MYVGVDPHATFVKTSIVIEFPFDPYINIISTFEVLESARKPPRNAKFL